jgi:hypothetical protein
MYQKPNCVRNMRTSVFKNPWPVLQDEPLHALGRANRNDEGDEPTPVVRGEREACQPQRVANG